MILFRIVRHIRTSLWFVPVMCVLAGVILSYVTITIDRSFDYRLVPETLTGGPDAATAILSTVALAMVSLATLVLTITMVVVQLAMGQFSPRIVQTILRTSRASSPSASSSPHSHTPSWRCVKCALAMTPPCPA